MTAAGVAMWWLSTLAAGALVLHGFPIDAPLLPAGASGAVLSFIDAAAGRVEVVRHWPDAPADVDVYPFRPYFWGECPGTGAMMMLVVAPLGGASPVASIVEALMNAARTRSTPAASSAMVQLAAALQVPGDPALEALKAAVPWISDLFTYERLGYAVFLFMHWGGSGCVVTVRAVPEGYGIPFVQ